MIKRILTGLVLIAIASFVIIKGAHYLFSFLLLTALCCAYELHSMNKQTSFFDMFGAFVAILVLFLSVNFSFFSVLWTPKTLLFIMLVLLVLIGLELSKKSLFFINSRILFNLRVITFFGVLFPVIFLTRELNQGLFLLGFSVATIAASDIVALFGGKVFGKTKLTEISPKKTVEGSFFGILGSVLISLIFSLSYDLNVLHYVLIAICISVASQFGDLHESLTKRYFNVKDSSNLLPGHGGFYDRADSIIFVVPLIYLIFS